LEGQGGVVEFGEIVFWGYKPMLYIPPAPTKTEPHNTLTPYTAHFKR